MKSLTRIGSAHKKAKGSPINDLGRTLSHQHRKVKYPVPFLAVFISPVLPLGTHWFIAGLDSEQAGTPARTEGRGARFLLRARYKHFCTKIIKSLERAEGAAAPCPPA